MRNLTLESGAAVVTFDRATVQLGALQSAAYAIASLATVDIRASDEEYVCTLFPRDGQTDCDALVHRIRSEVIDQTLRLQIVQQTEPLRNLIFALAFSQTGLADEETS